MPVTIDGTFGYYTFWTNTNDPNTEQIMEVLVTDAIEADPDGAMDNIEGDDMAPEPIFDIGYGPGSSGDENPPEPSQDDQQDDQDDDTGPPDDTGGEDWGDSA